MFNAFTNVIKLSCRFFFFGWLEIPNKSNVSTRIHTIHLKSFRNNIIFFSLYFFCLVVDTIFLKAFPELFPATLRLMYELNHNFSFFFLCVQIQEKKAHTQNVCSASSLTIQCILAVVHLFTGFYFRFRLLIQHTRIHSYQIYQSNVRNLEKKKHTLAFSCFLYFLILCFQIFMHTLIMQVDFVYKNKTVTDFLGLFNISF